MKINESYFGFTLESITPAEESGALAHLFIHNKTKARLLWLQNEDTHKTFAIGFRTPPADSTGVAHIVEHCVLSGSRKFKTREPFMEMYKTSMQTFLNAMTYQDMTLYPISTKNDTDFLNLSDVYLDAVFFPSMYERKEVFLQEGWHHELLRPEDDIIYKGVVYNEMRGAFSNAESQIELQVQSALHPDGTYSHESGGYPYTIPSLSYQDFLAFHKRYYHPSNSLIYLYGKVPFEAFMQRLDEEYLALFEASTLPTEIDPGEPLSAERKAAFYYNAEEGASEEKQAYLSYSTTIGQADDVYTSLLHALLDEILVGSESSPLKQALLEKQFGEDLISLKGHAYHLDFGLAVKNADAARLDAFRQTVEDTLQDIVRKGLPEDLVLAALNKLELFLRRAWGSNKGIFYFVRAMGVYRYGLNPLEGLQYSSLLEQVRHQISGGILEQIIQERILANPAKLIAVHRPQPGLFKAMDEEQAQALKRYKASLDEQEIHALIEENEKLLKFQQTEDSPEDKATLPYLTLEDIQREITAVEQSKVMVHKAEVLLHPVSSGGVCYVNMAFSLESLNQEELVYASYLAEILGIIDTREHKYTDLNNEILKYTAGIRLTPKVYIDHRDSTKYYPKLMLSAYSLGMHTPKLFALVAEVLLMSDFSDSKRLLEVLQRMRSQLEMHYDNAGNEVAMRRVKSYFSQAGRYKEEMSGLELYFHLQDLLDHYEERVDAFKSTLQAVSAKIFNQTKLIVAMQATAPDLERMNGELTQCLERFPVRVQDKVEIHFDLAKRNEGILSAGGVQYVSKGASFKPYGVDYQGNMVVVKALLSRDFLHNQIRAQGGAYGAGVSIEPSGDVITFSYRDPNLKKTVQVYDEMGRYLRELNLEEPDITHTIIGTLMSFDPVIDASELGEVMLARYISGITKQDIEERLHEAMATTLDDLRSYADLFDRLMQENYLCVYGNAEEIKKEEQLFIEIRPLKKN